MARNGNNQPLPTAPVWFTSRTNSNGDVDVTTMYGWYKSEAEMALLDTIEIGRRAAR